MINVRGIVSVYDPEAQAYTYYRVKNPPGRPMTLDNPVGTPIEEALPLLPRDARQVGRGARALGTVVQGRREWPWKDWALKGLAVLGAVTVLRRVL